MSHQHNLVKIYVVYEIKKGVN